MAFQSPSDGAPVSPFQQSFGTPVQTKVSSDRQRETAHESCLAAKLSSMYSQVPIKKVGPNKQVGWIFHVNFLNK